MLQIDYYIMWKQKFGECTVCCRTHHCLIDSSHVQAMSERSGTSINLLPLVPLLLLLLLLLKTLTDWHQAGVHACQCTVPQTASIL